MAYLMGQLGLAPSQESALPLLFRAATLASVDVPQPAYVYGLLLLQEFTHVQIPLHLFAPLIPPGSDAPTEARRHLERAAYLNFSPAQYKLGHSYEFATPPFPFDALLSVQYYSLASQQGEIEADMALSKWFLCGAEGAFEKDEALAWTFAEKAAKRGLPSAEFAMGYYAEVGVGGPKDIESARRWYTKVGVDYNLFFFVSFMEEGLTALGCPGGGYQCPAFLSIGFCPMSRTSILTSFIASFFHFILFNLRRCNGLTHTHSTLRRLNMEIQTQPNVSPHSPNPHLKHSPANNTKTSQTQLSSGNEHKPDKGQKRAEDRIRIRLLRMRRGLWRM